MKFVGVPPQPAPASTRAMSGCSHCGKQGAALKRCSRCKQVSYCGAACQNAAWKGHKKTCVTQSDLIAKLNAANFASDWRGVLKWEGRMEELMENQDDAGCATILHMFAEAHRLGSMATLNRDHSLSIVSLCLDRFRRVELLGKMQRFRDQGEVMCTCAENLLVIGRRKEGEEYFHQARKIGQAHGFISVECTSCLGLGKMAMLDGRTDEGVELLRNALVAAPLCEGNPLTMELDVLQVFTTLCLTHAIDEAEKVILRYREAAKAESDKVGHLSYWDFHSIYASARLHEARGRPEEAAREVRALLDLMRDNEADVQELSGRCQDVLRVASLSLKILDPAHGEEELIQSVADQMAKLRLG